jgi:predicted enzyme related to lactoylglutathione lyase
VRGYADATPCWAELATSDVLGAQRFYRELLGWETDPELPLFRHNGLAVAGVVPAGGAPGWLTYVSVEDLESIPRAVAEAGGTLLLPPTDVGDRGRMALFADRHGAILAAWRRGTFSGAQVGNEPNTICWAELASRDHDGSAAFYHTVFGWGVRDGELVPGIEYSEWMSAGRVVGGMVPMGPEWPESVPPHWRITIEVDNTAETVRRCVELGGQVMMGPLDAVVGDYAMLLDPYGAMFAVISMVPELRVFAM